MNEKREVTLRNTLPAEFKRYGIFRPNLSQKETEKSAAPFKNSYDSMNFLRRKSTKSIVKELERYDLYEQTLIDWAAQSQLVPEKTKSITWLLVVGYYGLNKQIEETCW